MLFRSERKEVILNQRQVLINCFATLKIIEKIYPTNANFILINVADADALYNKLVAEKVITRNRNSVIKNCIRVTVGTKEENEKLIKVLKNFNIA